MLVAEIYAVHDLASAAGGDIHHVNARSEVRFKRPGNEVLPSRSEPGREWAQSDLDRTFRTVVNAQQLFSSDLDAAWIGDAGQDLDPDNLSLKASADSRSGRIGNRRCKPGLVGGDDGGCR